MGKKLELPVPEWQTQHGCVCVFEFKKKVFLQNDPNALDQQRPVLCKRQKVCFQSKAEHISGPDGFQNISHFVRFWKKKKSVLESSCEKIKATII